MEVILTTPATLEDFYYQFVAIPVFPEFVETVVVSPSLEYSL